MHKAEQEDFSGVQIHYTDIPQPRTASTMLVVTGGQVQPHSTESFEAACLIDEPVEMHPFAFRVHTHKRGKSVAGWVVTGDEETEKDQWTLIGERDPQKEQLFEPIKNQTMIIQTGDVVAARCIIKNDEDRIIGMGPTGADEMCNFYLMYWVDGQNTLSDNTCYSPGAPEYRWNQALNNQPQ